MTVFLRGRRGSRCNELPQLDDGISDGIQRGTGSKQLIYMTLRIPYGTPSMQRGLAERKQGTITLE